VDSEANETECDKQLTYMYPHAMSHAKRDVVTNSPPMNDNYRKLGTIKHDSQPARLK